MNIKERFYQKLEEVRLADLTKPSHKDMKAAAFKKKEEEEKAETKAKKDKSSRNKKAWGYIKTGSPAFDPRHSK